MKNLTAPKQYSDQRGSTFDAGCEGLVLFTAAGDKVRLHVGNDGFLYINGAPFGVRGMPPALHAAMHAADGSDALTPAMIGAVSQSLLTADPKAGGVPVLDADGKLNSAFIADLIDPAHHALSHAAGAVDAITPLSIRAVADTDPRLEDKRNPLDHAAQHKKGQPDALTPADIGAVPEDDARLTNRRAPLGHNTSHHKNGPDPISWEDVGAVDAGRLTVRDRVPGGVPQLNDIGHIDVNLLPQFALRPALHADAHASDGVDPVAPISIGAADRKHAHEDADILSLDAGKIVSGTIDMARLPAAALERLIDVENEAARYALTVEQVQNGDSARQTDTAPPTMWRVVDDTKLDGTEGWAEYAAGTAARVPWAGVEGKPSAFTPESHATRHHAGGVDEITPAGIGAPTLAQHTEALTLAQQGVDDAQSARVLAVAAQAMAEQGVADAAAAHANAETRALQTDLVALVATVAVLTKKLAALEVAAVTSVNISAISGTMLADGVGMLAFEPK